MSLFSPDQTWKPPPTPFGGFIDGKPAQTAPHLLVSGPSGVGKSRRVLGPGILMWRGPVVAVSSKPDLIDLCLEQRLAWGGHDRTYVLDLSGEVPDEVLPEGVRKVVVDPTALIRTDDDALDLASVLMQAGAAGAGGGSNKGGGDPFWENVSTAPLAALLRATSWRGIAWTRAAVSRIDADLDENGNPVEEDQPCWMNAIDLLAEKSGMLAAELESAMGLDPKMRDSIMVTMKSAVAPWLRSTVAGDGKTLAFTPELLAHPQSTLFIVAPATGVAAGAAVSAVDFISKRWRANQTEPVKLPRLLMVVDELCNTMPWSKLPTVVTESRAMGIHLLVAVQATSQLAKRYGSDGMAELREVFPAVLLLVGAPEKEMLERAAWWAGQSERQKVATDHLGRQSQSAEKVDALVATDLLPRSMDEGRLLRGSRPGTVGGVVNEAGLLVTLVDISAIKFNTTRAA
jgi:type IV secretion system protein VirD4